MNLFDQIRLHQSDLLRTANAFCDQHVKLAKTIQMKHFNLRCKRTNVFPKSIVGQPPIRTREAFIYYQQTVPRQALKFFINDNCKKITNLYYTIKNLLIILTERLPLELFKQLVEKAKERYNTTKVLEKRSHQNSSQDQLLNYINNVNSNLQFTLETEINKSLPYLDLEIFRQEDGAMKFKVHRKPSHTGRLLNYNSSSHMAHKRSTIRSLVSRAFKICSEEYLENELTLIKEQLSNNGYPRKMIVKEIQKYRVVNDNRSANCPTDNIDKKFIAAPYICLLYTSPSPRDKRQSRMPSSA